MLIRYIQTVDRRPRRRGRKTANTWRPAPRRRARSRRRRGRSLRAPLCSRLRMVGKSLFWMDPLLPFVFPSLCRQGLTRCGLFVFSETNHVVCCGTSLRAQPPDIKKERVSRKKTETPFSEKLLMRNVHCYDKKVLSCALSYSYDLEVIHF